MKSPLFRCPIPYAPIIQFHYLTDKKLVYKDSVQSHSRNLLQIAKTFLKKNHLKFEIWFPERTRVKI